MQISASERILRSKVAIISDHPLTPYALKKLTREHLGLEPVLQLSTVNLRRTVFDGYDIDLILFEIPPDASSGVILVQQLRRWLPEVRILTLLAGGNPEVVGRLIEAGVCSVWTDRSPIQALLVAMRRTVSGNGWIDPTCDPVPGSSTDLATPVPQSGQSPLSRREREILELIQQGYSNQQVADRLYLSVNTVKNHMSRILAKLSAANRTDAVLKAMQGAGQ